MWFLLTLHFGHRARHEARQMKFGDIVLRKDEASGEEHLEWSTERESKTRHGDENEHRRSFRPKAYETGDRKCPVACYKEFVYRRPEEAKSPESPFFLAVHHQRKPEDRIWFSKRPMGKKQNRPIPFKRHEKPAIVYEREIHQPLAVLEIIFLT